MKNATYSLGFLLFFLVCATSSAVAQTNTQKTKGVRARMTKQVQPSTDITKRATTVTAQNLQVNHNRNLIRTYGKAIGKEVFSTADFNAMDAAKQAYVSTRPNEFLIVSDPLTAAQNYFTQKKAN